MKCVVGRWQKNGLDKADRKALQQALDRGDSRASLYLTIYESEAGNPPFALTAFKDHVRGDCVCFRE